MFCCRDCDCKRSGGGGDTAERTICRLICVLYGLEGDRDGVVVAAGMVQRAANLEGNSCEVTERRHGAGGRWTGCDEAAQRDAVLHLCSAGFGGPRSRQRGLQDMALHCG